MEKSLGEQQIAALQTAEEYIVKLINGINMCINSIEKDEQEESIKLVSYIAAGIDWLNEVVKLTKDIQIKNMDEEDMYKKLEKLKEYANREDYNKILNILKYEILDILISWKENINKSLAS